MIINTKVSTAITEMECCDPRTAMFYEPVQLPAKSARAARIRRNAARLQGGPVPPQRLCRRVIVVHGYDDHLGEHITRKVYEAGNRIYVRR